MFRNYNLIQSQSKPNANMQSVLIAFNQSVLISFKEMSLKNMA